MGRLQIVFGSNERPTSTSQAAAYHAFNGNVALRSSGHGGRRPHTVSKCDTAMPVIQG
jgi:hypothetical protein